MLFVFFHKHIKKRLLRIDNLSSFSLITVGTMVLIVLDNTQSKHFLNLHLFTSVVLNIQFVFICNCPPSVVLIGLQGTSDLEWLNLVIVFYNFNC